ncbi:MAG: phosphatase PAP2 family protein [Verrucomicrobiales bacterium]|nr:phosphatase PAP2 family protein [Verrucomicrobiales bacterium]
MTEVKGQLLSAFRLLKKDFRIVFWKTGKALWRGRTIAVLFMISIVITALILVHPHDERVAEHNLSRNDIHSIRLLHPGSAADLEKYIGKETRSYRWQTFYTVYLDIECRTRDDIKTLAAEGLNESYLERVIFSGRNRVIYGKSLERADALNWQNALPSELAAISEVQLVRVSKQNIPTRILARKLGKWGDFAQYNLVWFVLIWVYGFISKKRWFQRLAVTTFYVALIAGLSCNALRFTTGRPRPYASVEDKFYGIPGVLKGWEYHGFPSGHTSTAMGMGAPVLAALGVYGLPVFAFSCSVGWSRIYQSKHYPTDVLVGGSFGMLYGCAAGWHLRKVRLRLKRRRRTKSPTEPDPLPLPTRKNLPATLAE